MVLAAGSKRGRLKSHHVVLFKAIERTAQEMLQNVLSSAQQVEKAKSKIKVVKTDYDQLKDDYEKLLQKCNSLLLENFELKKRIKFDAFF